jgi:hypothetical protein
MVSPQDYALVEQVLAPISAEAMVLFARMPVDAQAHSLRVLKTLRADGTSPGAVLPDLAVAALLHDVGKVAADDAGVYLGLWLRGPLVLLEAWRPDLLARLASPHASAGLRYALYVHSQHPQIGADWAGQAGCSALACWLIAHHQDKAIFGAAAVSAVATAEMTDTANAAMFDLTTARHCLVRLQWADGRN